MIHRSIRLMKTSLALLALISTLHAAEPPSCEWVFSGGGSGHDKTRAVTTDRAGNVFLASECVGDAMFGDQRHKSAGEMDMCLTKLDAAGKPVTKHSLNPVPLLGMGRVALQAA